MCMGLESHVFEERNLAMKIAILCRENCEMSLDTAEYFHRNNLEISLFIVELGIRQGRSKTEQKFYAAHEEFENYLRIESKSKKLVKTILKKIPLIGKAIKKILHIFFYTNVFKEAKKMGIKAVAVEKHSSVQTQEIIEKNDITYVLLTSSAWLIKEPLLSMEKTKIINAHCAKLPEHRSLDALPWSVMENDKIGMTAHLVDEGVDTGAILLFIEVIPQKGDTLYTLRNRVNTLKPEIFFKAVQGLTDGTIKPLIQKKSEGTHHRPMSINELIEAENVLQDRLESSTVFH